MFRKEASGLRLFCGLFYTQEVSGSSPLSPTIVFDKVPSDYLFSPNPQISSRPAMHALARKVESSEEHADIALTNLEAPRIMQVILASERAAEDSKAFLRKRKPEVQRMMTDRYFQKGVREWDLRRHLIYIRS